MLTLALYGLLAILRGRRRCSCSPPTCCRRASRSRRRSATSRSGSCPPERGSTRATSPRSGCRSRCAGTASPRPTCLLDRLADELHRARRGDRPAAGQLGATTGRRDLDAVARRRAGPGRSGRAAGRGERRPEDETAERERRSRPGRHGDPTVTPPAEPMTLTGRAAVGRRPRPSTSPTTTTSGARPLHGERRAVRAAVAGGVPVRAVLADHPAQASRVPRGVRRLRRRRGRRVRRRRRRPAARRRRHRPQPGEDRGDDRERPRGPVDACRRGSTSCCGRSRPPARPRPQTLADVRGDLAGVGRDGQGAQAARASASSARPPRTR